MSFPVLFLDIIFSQYMRTIEFCILFLCPVILSQCVLSVLICRFSWSFDIDRHISYKGNFSFFLSSPDTLKIFPVH
jgi:hypothetical protein